MKICFVLCVFCVLQKTLSDDVSTPHQCMAPSNEKCFTVIVDQRLTWNDAEKYCEKNLPNGRLASIHNAFEGAVIAGWLPFLATDPWIGAYQIGSLPFQWTDASSLDYSNWAPGQPTNLCAQVCHSTASNAGIQCQQGKWRTADCDTSVAQIMCEYGNFSTAEPPTVVQRACNSNNGKCFALITGSVEWSEAETFCRSQNENNVTMMATLASVSSKSDADIIATFLQYPTLKSNVWIGAFAYNGGPFSWTDRSEFSFTNWGLGQPPSDPDGCVQVCLKNDSTCVQEKWAVLPCTRRQSIVCEIISKDALTGTDCLDLHLKYSSLQSGIYTLTPPGIADFSAYCDMNTDGGGWTVFQRRMDSSLTFYDKTWTEYKKGFNNGLSGNLWLGNDKIHVLSTKDANVELRIDIWGDRAPGASNPNVYLYGKYESFSIDNEANYYTFHISSSSTGNASETTTDSIYYSNGKFFSTIDVDHDNWDGKFNCSGYYQLGGWWLDRCTSVCLNGKYIPSEWHSGCGFLWYTGTVHDIYNPAQSRMMLRKLGM